MWDVKAILLFGTLGSLIALSVFLLLDMMFGILKRFERK